MKIIVKQFTIESFVIRKFRQINMLQKLPIIRYCSIGEVQILLLKNLTFKFKI